MTAASQTDVPVHKTITVHATVEHAFAVFTDGFDTWWPRSHHIGKVPMDKAFIEPREGGRCYSRQVDGTDCDWGRVLVWDPPHRLVLSWQITPAWGYEPDVAKCSEVDIRFTSELGGRTRVDLEHRHFERHGADGARMRATVDSPNGWNGLLALFAGEVTRRTAPFAAPALEPLWLIFKLNHGLMQTAIEGLSDRDAWHRPTEKNNPMLWILGHVISTRVSLLGLLGETFETGWGDRFKRGAELRERAHYPSLLEVERMRTDVGTRLRARLAALTTEDLAGPASGPKLPGAKTLADQIAFFAFHESYHVGQLGYVRKALGHPSMVG